MEFRFNRKVFVLMTLKKDLKVYSIQITMLFLIAMLFSYFRFSQNSDNQKIISIAQSLLKNEASVANSYALSKSIVDLEKADIFHCTSLTEKQNFKVFYNSLQNQRCYQNIILKMMSESDTEIQAINGLIYQFKIQKPILWNSVFLELVTYLLFSLIYFIYHKEMKIRKIRKKLRHRLFYLLRKFPTTLDPL